MADKVKLTVACGDYEIVCSLKEQTVEADGIDLVMLMMNGDKRVAR